MAITFGITDPTRADRFPDLSGFNTIGAKQLPAGVSLAPSNKVEQWRNPSIVQTAKLPTQPSKWTVVGPGHPPAPPVQQATNSASAPSYVGMTSGGGGYGGGGGAGFPDMSGYLAQLAGMLGQQQAAQQPKEPEKPKTEAELHPNGTPSGPNYKDPRMASPSWIGGANLFDDTTAGKNFTTGLAASRPAQPSTPANPTTPGQPPKPTTPKPTTPKPTKPGKPSGHSHWGHGGWGRAPTGRPGLGGGLLGRLGIGGHGGAPKPSMPSHGSRGRWW